MQPTTANKNSIKTISVQEAARALGVGRRLVTAAVKSGQIPSVLIGKRWRVPVAALQDRLAMKKVA
jgi:excisionase family DNA binding protein